MNKFSMKKLLSILLCIALIAALALSTVGCSKNDKTEPVASAETSGGTVSMGEGETMFLFNVVDPEGKESHFEIHTASPWTTIRTASTGHSMWTASMPPPA